MWEIFTLLILTRDYLPRTLKSLVGNIHTNSDTPRSDDSLTFRRNVMEKLRRTSLAWIASLALGLVATPAMARDGGGGGGSGGGGGNGGGHGGGNNGSGRGGQGADDAARHARGADDPAGHVRGADDKADRGGRGRGRGADDPARHVAWMTPKVTSVAL